MTLDFAYGAFARLFGIAICLKFTTHWYLDDQMGRKFIFFGKEARWYLPYLLPVDRRITVVKKACNFSFMQMCMFFIASIITFSEMLPDRPLHKPSVEKSAFNDTTLHLSDSERNQLKESFKKEMELKKK
ncbi:MAG TPA: hypothetical protein VGQ53_19020 [Chitinophagaceae bacterium]|jgi:hypothetical protein|nr:hypothetical protein [Chitinophagaceae bacterium]